MAVGVPGGPETGGGAGTAGVWARGRVKPRAMAVAARSSRMNFMMLTVCGRYQYTDECVKLCGG